METNGTAVVIMAAGKGTRMKNPEMAKVMYEVDGKPMVRHVVETAQRIGSSRIIVIVGHQRQSVIEYLRKTFGDGVGFAEQVEQRGTGHAIMQTGPLLKDFDGDVIVLSGDVPLLRQSTLEELQACHRRENAAATILTADVGDPKGYGRMVRSADGSVERIVEERDADEATRRIREINSGIYIFRRPVLFDALSKITPQNSQNEYYLTDVFHHIRAAGLRIAALKAADFDELRGVNTVEQLEEIRKIFERRKEAVE